MAVTSERAEVPRVSLVNNPKIRAYAVQVLLLALLAWAIYEIVANTAANLAKLNKGFGFDFLSQSAGFDIIQTLLPYSSASSYGRAILVGFWNTILVASIGIVLTTFLGFLVGVMRLSKNWLIATVATIYVETMRNIPLLLQIFMWYALVLKPLPAPKQAVNLLDMVFLSNRGVDMPKPVFGEGAWLAGVFLIAAIAAAVAIRLWAIRRQEQTGQQFPHVLAGLALIVLSPLLGLVLAGWPLTFDYPVLGGFNFKGGLSLIPELIALLTALSIYTAAFIAEIVRAGILAVSHGQSEAAHALGIRHGPTLRLVIIPQALRVIIPPLASQYLNLTKNSSLAIAIAYPDLVAMGGVVMNQSGRAIEVVFVWMIVYLSLSLLTAAFMNWYNARKRLVER
jgi:general L-amino acid transport system permease protein